MTPAPPDKAKSCPHCGKPAGPRYRPFCSRRCADLDLGRWLDGDYRIPAVEAPDGFDPEDFDGAEAPPPGGDGEDGR